MEDKKKKVVWQTEERERETDGGEGYLEDATMKDEAEPSRITRRRRTQPGPITARDAMEHQMGNDRK